MTAMPTPTREFDTPPVSNRAGDGGDMRKHRTMNRTSLRVLTVALVAAVGVAPVAVPSTSHAVPIVARDAAVITEWNVIAARTILAENATPVPASSLYLGFVSLATYDAVVTIEGRYEPYVEQPRAHAHASAEVAAATAAYRVLSHYFPASGAALATDYAASLDDVPNGVGKVHGIRVGDAAAAAVIDLRQDDGRGASVAQPGGLDPGVWRPTPDAFAPMLVPWLGFVTPLLLDSPTQIPLPGPDPLDTDAYTQDFVEVKQYGARDGSLRNAEQTATALFWNANAVAQYQATLRDQVTRRGLDIVDSARAFAILNASTADALIACWRAKYDYVYWRPSTAIQLADTDGNDATEPDPAWTPLIANPPYPDYTSGHACITGATSQTVSYLFGADSIDLNVPSLAATPARHFATADALDQETMNARIWLGIHFRKAMTDGNQLGHDVTDYGTAHYFQPTG
jgi:hypothetical protein